MDQLESLLRDMEVCKKDIEEGKSRGGDQSFNADSYWKNAAAVYQRLSSDATKLALACNSPPGPSPEALAGLVSTLEGNLLALVSAYHNLPKSQGQTLWQALQQSVLRVFSNVESLVRSIQVYQAGAQEQRSCAGLVWQETDAFSHLPKDNVAATLCVMEENLGLVQDALSELEEALASAADEDQDGGNKYGEDDDDEDDDEPKWSAADKPLLAACSGLVKTSLTVLKKSVAAIRKNGRHDSSQAVAELDKLVELVTRLSPQVDNLATSMYPPISHSAALEGVSQLAVSNSALLSHLRDSHLTGEDEQKWVEFLVRANDHNQQKSLACLGHQV